MLSGFKVRENFGKYGVDLHLDAVQRRDGDGSQVTGVPYGCYVTLSYIIYD